MRFIRGHALVHVLSLVVTSLERSPYLSCACKCGPSWVWSERRLVLPYVYKRPLEQLESGYIYIFLQGNPQLGYLFVLASEQCMIWTFTWRICFVIEVPFIYHFLRRFWRGFWSVKKSFQSFLRNLACMSHSISSWMSYLVAGSLTVWHLV